MRQYARLDFHGGCWHLMTGNAHDCDRKWANRDSALSELAAEGWIVDGPHGKQPKIKHDADRHFYGYALKRTILRFLSKPDIESQPKTLKVYLIHLIRNCG